MNIIKACKGGAQVRDINQQMHRSMALSFILAQEDPMRHQFEYNQVKNHKKFVHKAQRTNLYLGFGTSPKSIP